MEMEEANRGKTRICSVLFADIVGYSKKSNVEQNEIKKQFVSLWAAATQGIPASDIMVVDSGDGAALTALVEPLDTLKVAVKLKNLLKEYASNNPLAFKVRLGINFGPVQLATDVHGNSCIVGDAINMAQRVMSFADDNQLAVSRSYYDTIVSISSDYKSRFKYMGAKADKHGREHVIFKYCDPEEQAAESSAGDNERPAAEPAAVVEPTPQEKNRLKNSLSGAFSSILGFIKGSFSVAMFVMVIYEAVVLLPLMDKPNRLMEELHNQGKSVKALFHFGDELLNGNIEANARQNDETASKQNNAKSKTGHTVSDPAAAGG